MVVSIKRTGQLTCASSNEHTLGFAQMIKLPSCQLHQVPYSSFRSAEACWEGLGFKWCAVLTALWVLGCGTHSRLALKRPMMPRLSRRLKARAPMVPRKEGKAAWEISHVRREAMSASTASIWKWVPTTAQMWNSWWLWPGRGPDR